MVGTSNVPGSFTQQLFDDSNITSLDYIEVKVNYTPDADGVYHFAFHGYSDPLQFLLFIDDFQITEQTPINAENHKISELKIYPNPAGDYVNIQMPETLVQAEVKIHDLTGRLMQATKFTGDFHQLNTSTLNSGVYILEVSTGTKIWKTRIIIG
jgi:hypothetical protein